MNTLQLTTAVSVRLLVLIGLTLFASPVAAQVFDLGPSDPALFDIVINVPTDPNIGAGESIGGDGLTTQVNLTNGGEIGNTCLLYTSPSPRDQRGSRMPSSA